MIGKPRRPRQGFNIILVIFIILVLNHPGDTSKYNDQLDLLSRAFRSKLAYENNVNNLSGEKRWHLIDRSVSRELKSPRRRWETWFYSSTSSKLWSRKAMLKSVSGQTVMSNNNKVAVSDSWSVSDRWAAVLSGRMPSVSDAVSDRWAAVLSDRKPTVSESVSDIVTATVNLSTVVSELPHFWSSTGFCSPDPHKAACDWLTSPDMVQNLAYIGAVPHDGITNVRVHFLLDTVTVYSFSSDRPKYNFSCLDTFIELLHRNGLYPGFEIMGNPSGMFTDFENRTQVYMWRDLIHLMASRYIDIYGLGYVMKWNFESWNEPKVKIFDGLNFTFTGFCNYYDASSEGLQLASKSLRFGGPSGGCKNTYKTSNYCWYLLDHLNNGTNYFTGRKDVRVDFISIHEKGECPHNSDVILEKERQFHSLLEKHQPNLVNIPVYDDEADPLVTWSRPLPWRADATYSSMIAKIVVLHQNAFIANKSSTMNLQLLSNDNGFLSYQPWPFEQRTLLARFQVNSTSSRHVEYIRKPAHGVMGLLSLLGNHQVKVSGKHPLIESGVIDILASTHTPTHSLQDSWQMAALVYYSRDTESPDTTWRSGHPPTVNMKLTFTHLPIQVNATQDILYVLYALDNGHGNAYRLWRSGGSPATPSPQLFDKMRAEQDPVRVQGPITVTDLQDFTIEYDLPLSGVLLIHTCAKPHNGPDQVGELTVYNVTFNRVLIVWSDSCVNTKCILRYDVEHSSSGHTGTFRNINPVDSIFTVFQYSHTSQDIVMGESVIGYYRVRAVDYWGRSGPYSPVVHYDT